MDRFASAYALSQPRDNMSQLSGVKRKLDSGIARSVDPQRTSATWAVALFVRHGNKRLSSHDLRICIARAQESADYSHKPKSVRSMRLFYRTRDLFFCKGQLPTGGFRHENQSSHLCGR